MARSPVADKDSPVKAMIRIEEKKKPEVCWILFTTEAFPNLRDILP